MVVFDFIYFLIVLWTGWVVSKHNVDSNWLTQLLSAILIVGSIKNIFMIFYR